MACDAGSSVAWRKTKRVACDVSAANTSVVAFVVLQRKSGQKGLKESKRSSLSVESSKKTIKRKCDYQ